MSVFSITALDRLIESDRRSSSMAAAASSGNGSAAVERQTGNPAPAQKERRPLYVSYPYSSTTTSAASTPPPRPRSPSPNSFSPSPYVVNHKRRVPNGGGDSKQRTSQQNGFHVSVSENSSGTRPSESQQELVSRAPTQQNINSQDRPSLNAGARSTRSQEGSIVKEYSSRSPQSSLALQFHAKNVNSNGNSTDGESWYRKPNLDEIRFDGSMAAATEEKTKGGKRVGSVERREMSSRTNDPRGKKKLDESFAASEGGISSRVKGNASSSASSIPDVFGNHSCASSTSGPEEWFDASEGLPDYASDDDSRRNSLSDPGPSSSGDPDFNVILQLKAEIQRRIAAEDAREALQHQRDGMAQLLYSAGISVPQSDFGAFNATETDKMLGVSDSESQGLVVARYVAGAVATGAVRAEAEAELQTVLAEKSREIARLKDKLQYYELVNHEMSQRNQESIENARQSRRRRQRIQRFVFFGLSAAVCVGVSVAAVSHYAPWEHVQDLSKGPVLPEGEQPNPASLEASFEQRDKLWIWHVIVRKGEAVIRHLKFKEHPDNQLKSVEPEVFQQDDCTKISDTSASCSCPEE